MKQICKVIFLGFALFASCCFGDEIANLSYSTQNQFLAKYVTDLKARLSKNEKTKSVSFLPREYEFQVITDFENVTSESELLPLENFLYSYINPNLLGKKVILGKFAEEPIYILETNKAKTENSDAVAGYCPGTKTEQFWLERYYQTAQGKQMTCLGSLRTNSATVRDLIAKKAKFDFMVVTGKEIINRLRNSRSFRIKQIGYRPYIATTHLWIVYKLSAPLKEICKIAMETKHIGPFLQNIADLNETDKKLIRYIMANPEYPLDFVL